VHTRALVDHAGISTHRIAELASRYVGEAFREDFGAPDGGRLGILGADRRGFIEELVRADPEPLRWEREYVSALVIQLYDHLRAEAGLEMGDSSPLASRLHDLACSAVRRAIADLA
jgi:hypothetical protein